jgi:hypothetical protein
MQAVTAYECGLCGRLHTTPTAAERCEDQCRNNDAAAHRAAIAAAAQDDRIVARAVELLTQAPRTVHLLTSAGHMHAAGRVINHAICSVMDGFHPLARTVVGENLSAARFRPRVWAALGFQGPCPTIFEHAAPLAIQKVGQ